MRHGRIGWFFSVAMALAILVPSTTQAGPEDLLQDQGLRRSGPCFMLLEEVTLSKKLRELDPLRKKMNDAQQKAAAAEQKVDQKKQFIMECFRQRQQLRAQLLRTKTVEAQNRIVTSLNELADRISVLERNRSLEKDAKAARATATELSEQFIETLLRLRKQHDEIAAKYEKLGQDPKVTQAIESFNKESSTPCKLGPTGTLPSVDKALKKLEGSLLSETIALRKGDGELWMITATFNGEKSQEFAIDTGASLIALPWKTAGKLGLAPSDTDPSIQCSLADGHVVEAKLVHAKSVRVGKFVVEHVECGVMPEDCPEAQPLLGLSFLKHFTFKIDTAKGALTLSQIESPGSRKQRPSGRTSPRDEKSSEPAEAKASDTPAAEPAEEKSAPERLAALLKPDDSQATGGFTLQRQGQPVQFRPAKQGPIESLRKRFGDPDEMIKLNRGPAGDGGAKLAPWKIWTWGNVHVVVDETGRTRFYAVVKE